MGNEKILVVEDEEEIRELITYNLEKERFRVTAVVSGEDALEKARKDVPDVVLLDLMLPGLDGLDVCRQIKHDPGTGHVPVIMLTARGDDADIVSGLELGADDYIVKPFSPRVLLARLKAVLRRHQTQLASSTSVLKVHDLVIDTGRHEVLLNGKAITLTATEFSILHLLARHPGWVFSRDQIIKATKGDDYPVTDRSVDVQIVGLRKKLGVEGDWVQTVRGVGYRLKQD